MHRPNVDPELCRVVGQIVIQWTTAEYLVTLLLGTILQADQAALGHVAGSIAGSTQAKWIRALLKSRDHEASHNVRVNELLGRFDELRQERNELVHGFWDTTGCDQGTALIQTVNLDRSEIIRSRLITPQDLNDLSNDVDSWIEDYLILGRELGFPRHRGQEISMFSDP